MTAKRMRGLLLLLLAGVVAVPAVIYSGVYNVAAAVPHSALVYRLLDTAKRYSVRVRAVDIEVPPLADPALIRKGYRHYRAHCEGCHGGPGVAPTQVMGLTPTAPFLIDVTRRWTPAQLYWITKNGIKMTGMPAWRLTQDDEDLWSMVAFLQAFPRVSPLEYQTSRGSVLGTVDRE